MSLSDRDWTGSSAATPQALAALEEAAPVPLPASYYRLLEASNGGEGPISRQPCYLVLDPAEIVTDAIKTGQHREFFEGFVIIGTNGAGEFIAFDTRGATPWPVVAIDMCNIDLSESVLPIASDFDAFLDLVGSECDDLPAA